ncbi:MAG: methionyl-tRNA formyltransferase [Bacteroidales bacterium]|jgi:methionyl-tRNA formyltransferase|nr:methionyl-tRNA formyltransferase [Bacteroidales bacterium]
MTKNELRIIFMGTPPFAAESLRTLVEDGYSIAAVVTAPDKPVGRHGNTLQPSAVKQYALSVGLPVLQPESLKDETFIRELQRYNANLQIVVAFRMLPEIVWKMPELGTFNLHASLLPQYRGAAPINHAIINGETETGVTTFFLENGMDTGKIILQQQIPIGESDDAGIMHDKLMTLGARLVERTLEILILADGHISALPQHFLTETYEVLHPAPKISRETCRIDWTKSAAEIYNHIRGLSPHPGAWTELTAPKGEKLPLKIFQSEKIFEKHSLPCGTVISDGKKHIDIAVSDGYIRLQSLQPSGRKRMNAKEFLNGTKL